MEKVKEEIYLQNFRIKITRFISPKYSRKFFLGLLCVSTKWEL